MKNKFKHKGLVGLLSFSILLSGSPYIQTIFANNNNQEVEEEPSENEDVIQVHQHTDECYTLVTNCIHEHTDECYINTEEPDSSILDEVDEIELENKELVLNCTHKCSVDSGCITRVLNCHDEVDEVEETTEVVNLLSEVVTVNSAEQLKEAIEDPTVNTILLDEDITLENSINIDRTVALDLQTHTITVNIPSTLDTTSSAFIVNGDGVFSVSNGKIKGFLANDNRAIEGKTGSNIDLNDVIIADFNAINGNGGAVYVENSTLTVYGCSLGYYDYDADEFGGYNKAKNGGAIGAKNSDITVEYSELFYNESSDATGVNSEHHYGGGAIFAEGNLTNITLKNNYFFANETQDYGGAIHLYDIANADIVDNKIEYSSAYNHVLANGTSRGGDGAGIYIGYIGTENGRIYIAENKIIGGDARNRGGGLFIRSHQGTIVLEANLIKDNYASKRGGGLAIETINSEKYFDLQLKSGEIIGNQANEFGAGIDYTGKGMRPLYLTNVLISENQAVRGAGIWTCPTSETYSYTTLGGAIYGNVVNKNDYSSMKLTGDDVRYEGKDSKDTFVNNSYQPNDNENTTLTVMKRALGGGKMSWYLDEEDNRYQAGVPQADVSRYTATNSSVGLHGELSEKNIELANSEAQLIIQGNTGATRGGGIASNSPIYIGKNEDVSVTVHKTWTEDEHPDEVTIDLYRVGKNGQDKVKLDSDVALNEENQWEVTFTDLPSKYVDKNGNIQECTYEIQEHELEGWKATSSTNFDENTRTYTIVLTNSIKELQGNLKVHKTVSGSKIDKTIEFPFSVMLSDDTISETYGDMTFTNGIATFTLRHDESKEATGLPAGLTYTVNEENNNGYVVTSENASGTIVDEKTILVHFDNFKEDITDTDFDGTISNKINVTAKKEWQLSNENKQTESVTVALLRNGKVYKTAELNDENHWSVQWKNLNDTDRWTVDEIDGPSGFYKTVTHQGNNWTITNTQIEDQPTETDEVITSTPDLQEKPIETVEQPKPELDSQPDTSANTHITTWIALSIISLFMSIVVLFCAKSRLSK